MSEWFCDLRRGSCPPWVAATLDVLKRYVENQKHAG